MSEQPSPAPPEQLSPVPPEQLSLALPERWWRPELLWR
jgi:hypothetical protein